MKTLLLAAVNAKYIHSNLGVYSLKAYAEQQPDVCRIELAEYTINQMPERILADLYRRKPDVLAFSCYIWNIRMVETLVRDLARVLPGIPIWLGGPEVSGRARQVLDQLPMVTGVLIGEGEETFAQLAAYYEAGAGREPDHIRGLVFRRADGSLTQTPPRPLPALDALPFPYKDLQGMENRILYYESSRGCPFSCSYCLSSIDKSVRFRSLDKVREELSFFLKNRVPQVKFVDRTFNCRKAHALAIWKYLLEHDNGVTNFHFEISADLLDEEELDVIRQMRPGLIQLEIGVQSANPAVIRQIRRTMDLDRVEQTVRTIRGFGNTHQHLDLIAGLPLEDMGSFIRSFDRVYRMGPDQLQLGFLKVLWGSPMAEEAADYGLVYREEPPYEVLSTRWLSYADLLRLKAVEEMLEVYGNSGQFSLTLAAMEKQWESPFAMFEELAAYYERNGLAEISHSRPARYEILLAFLRERLPEQAEAFRERLVCDFYLRENAKSRPAFAPDPSPWKERIRTFFEQEEKRRVWLEGYASYDARQMSRMVHTEVQSDGSLLLFDYLHRDPLRRSARLVRVPASD